MNLSEPKCDLQLWLEMLVDGELPDDDVGRLVEHLDQHPKLWRRCAVAFINDLAVDNAIRGDRGFIKRPPSNSAASLRVRRSLRTRVGTLGILCAAMLVGFFLHSMISGSRPPAMGSDHILAPDVAANVRPVSLPSFGSVRTPHMMMEIEDSPERAVYFVDHTVPRFLLEAIVLAGHSIEVKQSSTSIVAADGQVLEIPINALEITKYVNVPTF